jgi:ADP-ribosylglycohydrolase
MALCLASSLVIRGDFIPYDQLVRYKWWFRNGYMSATGKCFDIGAATKKSLIEFERRQRNFAQKNKISEDMDSLSNPQLLKEFNVDCSNKEVAGNGALMRLAPVPLFFHKFPNLAVEFSGVSGRITHGDESAYDACRYYGALIVAALKGAKKSQLLDDRFYIENNELFSNKPLHSEIIRIAKGSYKQKRGYDDGIRGKGYIVHALEAALWAFWSTEKFETGALAAVNLGDDADTTAAIYGQLAGAHYGFEQLPVEWLKYLYARRFIECLSKWIVFEGERWQPDRSVALIINVPASQGQSNNTTNSSAKQNRNSDPQTTASQRAYGTKPDSKQNNKTQPSNAATASNAQGYPNNGQYSDWNPDSLVYRNSTYPNPTQYQDGAYLSERSNAILR